ncbi:MAG: HlyD family efflux transporter periplasmic adaptor subunit [Chloroflexi bacterium]|nr:HlyD family efflux transporter periplasmic adaptor subunit [Chloroflexota bacterium]
MMKKRTLLIGGVVVALVAGGVYLATRSTSAAPTGVAAALANLPTVPVVRTTLANSVDSTGSLIAETVMDLSFDTSGTVTAVNVAVGDRVKQGAVLATLDAADLELKVAQAEQSYLLQQLTYSNTVEADPGDIAVAQAAYDNAQAGYAAALTDFNNLAARESVQCSQLTTARQSLDRAQTAYDRIANDHQASQYLNADWGPYQNIVKALENAKDAYTQAVSNCNVAKLNLNDSALRSAQAQVHSAKTTLDNLISPRLEKQIQAKAQLEQSRLSLEAARRALADAVITAPYDGLVTAVNITVGGASGSSAALVLADTSRFHVDVLVDETQIAQVQVGQHVDLTLDALTGITLTGQVSNIDLVGTVSQGVVNYKVRVDLNSTDAAVLIDMTANASILGERHENILAVPATAVRTGGLGAFGGQGATGQGRPNAAGGQGATSGRVVTDTQSADGQTRQRASGSFVLAIENGQPRPVQVTTGLTSGDLVEVTGDLKEGDLVVVGELTLPTGVRPTGGFPGGGGGFPGGGPGGGAGGPPPF